MKNQCNAVVAQIASENDSTGLDVSQEFINQGKNIKSKKKGGPYPKHLQYKRKDEVYKLFFEYGYSERKIADVMKTNRSTVKSDLDYWFKRIIDKKGIENPEIQVQVYLERLDIQRTRLRESLNKGKTFQEKITIEKLIFEIDNKIIQMLLKLSDSEKRLLDQSTDRINEWLKENKKDTRYMRLEDKLKVSRKAFEKIQQIIKEDNKQFHEI